MLLKQFKSFIKVFKDHTTDGKGKEIKLIVRHNAMYFPRENSMLKK